MKQLSWIAVVVSLVLTGAAAHAQVPFNPNYNPGGYGKPPVSPYLNLFNNNKNSPAYNYYTQVQPQMQFQSGIQGLRNQYGALQQSVTTLEQSGPQGPAFLPPTGHLAGFMTHHVYFNNLSGAGTAGSGGSTAGFGGRGGSLAGVGGVGGVGGGGSGSGAGKIR